MYDDTSNPSDMQGRGVHPPHEETFFVTCKPPQLTKFHKIFKLKPHTPLGSAHAPMAHFDF